MTALERVKQELGWWIEYRHILGWMVISPSATRPAGAADVELFSAFLRLAEENEMLKKQMEEK